MAEEHSVAHITLQMLSQPRFLSAARSMVANIAQRLGFNEIRCGQISLAVDEALCNIINHGYEKREDGMIWIRIRVLEGERTGMQIVIEDEARQVDPTQIKSRDLDDIRPGGLGVYIIREIMDEVRYEKRDRSGMRLTLVKWLSEDDDSGPTVREEPSSRKQSLCEPGSSPVGESDATHERQ